MTDIEKLLRERVNAFTEEISDLIRQAALERLSDALGAPAPSPARTSAKRGAAAPAEKRVAKRGKGQKRAPAEMERLIKSIVSTVQAQPGIRADQLADQLGIATRDTSLPIKKLLAEKSLTKKGQKRATQYFVAKGR